MNYIQLRSNQKFDVAPENGEMIPSVELIILCHSKPYELINGDIAPTHKITTIRMNAGIDGVDNLIKSLMAIKKSLKAMKTVSDATNSAIAKLK